MVTNKAYLLLFSEISAYNTAGECFEAKCLVASAMGAVGDLFQWACSIELKLGWNLQLIQIIRQKYNFKSQGSPGILSRKVFPSENCFHWYTVIHIRLFLHIDDLGHKFPSYLAECHSTACP